MEIVADYLEIEKERLGQRLNYRLDLPTAIEHLEVPPLSVQTLVENSVKHAIAPSRAGGTIRVKARTQHDRLLLEIWDSGPGFNLDAIPSGRGLDNLQVRLTTLFGDSSSVGVHPLDVGSVVTVSLPQVSSEVAEPQ
jgi:LytS/YehU family sensor histidine kinase